MAGAVGIVFGLCVLSFTLGAALMYVLVRRREDAAEPATAEAPDDRTWVNKPAAVEPVDADYDSRPIHRNPVMGLRQMEPALASLVEPVGMRQPVEAVAERQPAKPVAGRDAESVADSRSARLSDRRVAEPVVERQPAKPSAGSGAKPSAGPVAEPVAALEPIVEPVAEREPVAEIAAEAKAIIEPIAEPETVGAAGYDWDGDLVPPVGNFEAPESTVAPSTDSPARLASTDGPAGLASTDGPESPDSPEAVEDSAWEPVEEPEPAPPVTVRTALPPPASPQPVEHTTWVEREDFRQRYLRTFEEVRRKAGSN